jgi:hypothetical protein
MDSLFKRVDEDEGSPLRGGVNRDKSIARENRRISGCPPSQPKLEIFPPALGLCNKPAGRPADKMQTPAIDYKPDGLCDPIKIIWRKSCVELSDISVRATRRRSS